MSPSGGLYEMLIAAMSLSLLQGRTLTARKSSALIFSKGAHMYYVWHRKCLLKRSYRKVRYLLCARRVFFFILQLTRGQNMQFGGRHFWQLLGVSFARVM